TDSVKVESPGSTDASGEQTAKVTWVGTIPSNDTTVNITAEFNLEGSPLSVSETTSVTFKMFGICGGQVNDTNKSNATGVCLKVAEADGKWFTSSPSKAVMDYLGYIKSDNNRPNTYKGLAVEDGTHGPAGEFAEFMYGSGMSDDGAQLDSYCNHLSRINFAGKSKWSQPSLADLREVDAYMYENFGWPTKARYWSATWADGEKYRWSIDLHNKNEEINGVNSGLYASCVSNP
ncbi:peptidase, partial [Vibrio sp. Vb2110]|nr:peptidase [Vibrio sp. Vb2130]MDW1882904.1 peptidase [Vibrio sp. Vb2110]MDW2137956.1 peptidase [Vibrio sp. 2128(2023)]